MSVRRWLPWLAVASGPRYRRRVVLSLAHATSLNAAITPALALFAGVGALLADRRPRNPIGCCSSLRPC